MGLFDSSTALHSFKLLILEQKLLSVNKKVGIKSLKAKNRIKNSLCEHTLFA